MSIGIPTEGTMKARKVGIYARVSTRDKGQDPETQLAKLRAYCEDRGWPWVEYIDRASGTTLERAGFQQLQKDIRGRRVNVVVVYSADRLARSLHHLIDITEEWGYRGVELVSLTQNIDTTTPMGRAFYQFIGIMAELERGMIIERVNAGLDRARREGKRLGRPKTRVRIPGEVLAAIKAGTMSVYQAAKVTGIPKSTLTRRLRDRGVVGSENATVQKPCVQGVTSDDR